MPPVNGATANATQITECYAPLDSPNFTGTVHTDSNIVVGSSILNNEGYGALRRTVTGSSLTSADDTLLELENNANPPPLNNIMTMRFMSNDSSGSLHTVATMGFQLTGLTSGAASGDLLLGTPNESMRITHAGNVGIGVTAPMHVLEVGPSTATALIGDALVGEGDYMSANAVFANNDALASSAASYALRQTSTGSTILNSSSGHPLRLRIGDAVGSGMYFSSDGTLNIGAETTVASGVTISNATGSVLNLNDTSATGSPYVEWDQAGTRRAYMQYNNAEPDLRLVSEGSGISLWANNLERVVVASSGNVGIGTTTPAQMLEVNGEVQVDSLATGTTTGVCITSANVLATCGSSSIRYKENVQPAPFGLEEVLRMRPVTFKWKGRDEKDFGLIAEEVAKINPLFATYRNGQIEGVKYPQLTAVLVNAVKTLSAQNVELRSQVAQQNVRLRTQAAEIHQMQAAIAELQRTPIRRTAANDNVRLRANGAARR